MDLIHSSLTKTRLSIWITLFLFILAGCQVEEDTANSGSSNSNSSNSSSTAVEKQVAFQFNFLSSVQSLSSTSEKENTTNSSFENMAAPSSRDFTSADVWRGWMIVRNLDTGIDQSKDSSHDWFVYFDDDTWAVQSNRTLSLPVEDNGTNYEFQLLLSKNNLQYLGTVATTLIPDGTADIAMNISPLIGETITDINFIEGLGKIKLNYNAQELSGIGTPQVGVIVDDLSEQLLTLNPATGESTTEISIAEGNHTIKLKLYDNGTQIGRSMVDQESVFVLGGQNMTMDLIRLQGETSFSLTEEGGDALFQFMVPSEVINKAGGFSNLEGSLRLAAGTKNSYQEQYLSLESSGDTSGDASGDYLATATLTGIQYDTINYSLVFSKKSNGEEIATCNVENVVLSNENQQKSCNISLTPDSQIQGNLLSTVTLSVINSDGEPVPGIPVYVEDLTSDRNERELRLLGISGQSSEFGTQGYLKGYLKEGSYQFRGEGTTYYGTVDVSADPLGVHNLILEMNQTLPSDWTFVDGNHSLGINYSKNGKANKPQLTAFQNKLYATWSEYNPRYYIGEIRVAVYQDSKWKILSRKVDVTDDATADASLNEDSWKNAYEPQLTGFQNQLYAIWSESKTKWGNPYIRVARYNGGDETSDWDFIDNEGLNSSAPSARTPQLTEFNNKLYAIWTDNSSGVQRVRVKVYQGGSSWSYVDGSSNTLNHNTQMSASHPQLTSFNGNLYATWSEVGSYGYKIRVKVYNGDDSSPAWTTIDGGGTSGLNIDSAKSAYEPQLASFNGKLYVTWHEYDYSHRTQIYVKVYNGSTWTSVSGTGVSKSHYQYSRSPQLSVFQNQLHITWDEVSAENAIRQVRLAVYHGDDQAPAWNLIDGGSNFGLNRNPSTMAIEPQITPFTSSLSEGEKLYSTWEEGGVIRVALVEVDSTWDSTWDSSGDSF